MSKSAKPAISRILVLALAALMAMTMLPASGFGLMAYAEPADVGSAVAADGSDTTVAPADEFLPPAQLAEPTVPQDSAEPTDEFLPLSGIYDLSTDITGGMAAGGLALSASSASAGTEITATATPAAGYYLAQLRYSADAGLTYTAIAKQSGNYSFLMPDSDVLVKADFVPIVWDGSIDITWFDPDASAYTLNYPAQYAGLAAIVNGLFTSYPTTPKLDGQGQPVSDSRGPVLLPSYVLYQQAMGVQPLPDGTPDGATAASALYGEFSTSYRLNDSQSGNQRTAPISKTARVIGQPAYIAAISSTGSPNEHNQMTTNDFWYGQYQESFHDKTVYIGSDLDFGGIQSSGVWDTSSPLFMPLGGQFSILPGSGDYTNGYSKLSASWNGNLDGLGHRFLNVYCEYYANTEYGDSATMGLIGRLGAHDNDPEAIRPHNPSVRQLVLESGYISGRRSVAGIVGKIGKTTKNNSVPVPGAVGGIIEFCVNKATVVATDAKGCAGICAASWNGGYVRYCANFGRIDYRYSDPGGGIVGYNEVPVAYSYNVGLVTAGQTRFAMGIGSNNGGGGPIVNCYWLTGQSAGGGYYGGSAQDSVVEFGPGKTPSSLTAALMNGSSALPQLWLDDSTGINAFGGLNYPILYFQAPGYNAGQNYSVTLSQPAVGGTLASSSLSAHLGDTIELTNLPNPGYVLDYFTVNGMAISGSSFVLAGNATVSAVFRQLKSALLNIEDTSNKPYTIAVTKTGIVIDSGSPTQVSDYPLLSGDTIYENDQLSLSVALKPDVLPDDPSLIYSGQFNTYIKYGNVSAFWGSSPRPVSSLDMDNAALGDGTAIVTTTAATVAKNWEQVADTSWFDSGNPQPSYTISTAYQLAGIAKLVNNGSTDFSGITLNLGANISLANADGTAGIRLWLPIGSGPSLCFKGSLNGNGRYISNMTVTKAAGSYAALFGYVSNATISNLVVGGAVNGPTYSAGFVGVAVTSTLSNLSNYATVRSSGNYAGGIVAAAANSTVTGCLNRGQLLPANDTVTIQYVGGIVGYVDLAVSGLAITGSTVSGCTNYAELRAGYNIGGIAGYLRVGTVSECANLGAITSNKTGSGGAGGIAGYLANEAKAVRSYNLGTIAAVGSPNTTYLGGISGYLSSSSIEDCYNRGSVNSTTGGVGGISGYVVGTSTANAIISRAYNTGAVSTATVGRFGGIAGYASGTYIEYTNVHYLTGVTGLINITNGYQAIGANNVSATIQTEASLKSLAPQLGAAFGPDLQSLNDGYPPLQWQQPLPPPVGLPGSGDLNGDGQVTILEAQTAMIAVTGLMILNPAQASALDIDGNGILTIADAMAIMRMVAGM